MSLTSIRWHSGLALNLSRSRSLQLHRASHDGRHSDKRDAENRTTCSLGTGAKEHQHGFDLSRWVTCHHPRMSSIPSTVHRNCHCYIEEVRREMASLKRPHFCAISIISAQSNEPKTFLRVQIGHDRTGGLLKASLRSSIIP